MTDVIRLELPEPPSRRKEDRMHWAPRSRLIRETKHEMWKSAIEQATPFAEAPKRVRVSAHFRLWKLDDSMDNLRARLKRVLDALKQNQPPGDISWRYVDGMRASWAVRGFFWDDDPAHLEPGEVTQEIDRKNRGVTVVIEPVGEAA